MFVLLDVFVDAVLVLHDESLQDTVCTAGDCTSCCEQPSDELINPTIPPPKKHPAPNKQASKQTDKQNPPKPSSQPNKHRNKRTKNRARPSQTDDSDASEQASVGSS